MGRTNPILHTQGRNFRIRSSGYLPHWELDDAIYSITIRLADSIPMPVLQVLGAERHRLLDRATTRVERAQIDRAFEVRLDVYADEGHGERLLARPGIAAMAMDAVRHFDGSRYTLHALAVMPNHVHVLLHLEQGQDLSRVAHSWKWYTGGLREQDAAAGRAILAARLFRQDRSRLERLRDDAKIHSGQSGEGRIAGLAVGLASVDVDVIPGGP
jgi:hypothetical protein